jgi:hypothetical protein
MRHSPVFPLEANHHRLYGPLEFEYTSHPGGFETSLFANVAGAFKEIFPFVVISDGLIDMRFRTVDEWDPNSSSATYCSEWVLIGIRKTAFEALRGQIRFEGRVFSVDTSNFKESLDRMYVTTVAKLERRNVKLNPVFTEILRTEQNGEMVIEEHTLGELEGVYGAETRSGIFRGVLKLEPFLIATVPDNGPEDTIHPCQLKFRLRGIRSFGEARGAYFAQMDPFGW